MQLLTIVKMQKTSVDVSITFFYCQNDMELHLIEHFHISNSSYGIKDWR